MHYLHGLCFVALKQGLVCQWMPQPNAALIAFQGKLNRSSRTLY